MIVETQSLVDGGKLRDLTAPRISQHGAEPDDANRQISHSFAEQQLRFVLRLFVAVHETRAVLNDLLFDRTRSLSRDVNSTQTNDPSKPGASTRKLKNIPSALHVHGAQLGQRRGESCIRRGVNNQRDSFSDLLEPMCV